jgi:hypothetical protein
MPAMNQQQPNEQQRRRISCTSIGCTAVIVLIVAFICLYIYDHAWWQCKIPLPDGSGTIIYKTRQRHGPDPGYVRKLILDTNKYQNIEKWLPEDYPLIHSPVNVYWYPQKDAIGPYLRFQDPNHEYLVDIQHGSTLLMIRMKDGSCYAGEILDGFPHVYKPEYGDEDINVNNRPAKRLPDSIARKSGEYIGRINKNYYGFTPAKEAPETKIETIRQ